MANNIKQRIADLSDALPVAQPKGRKLTQEFVADRFAEAGYELLGEYVNKDAPTRFRCDKGHEHQMSWNNFRQGSRCGVCAGKHLNPEEALADEGYELLGEYASKTAPIRFRCNKGHEHQMSWGSFRKGQRCGVCAGKHLNTAGVKKALADEGYELLGEYVNAHAPIKFRCNKGHEHQMSWNSFQNGSRCGVCAGKHHNPADVKKARAAEVYELLGEYVSATAPIRFRCNKGHEHQVSWDSFDQGTRCGVCFGKYVNPEDVKKAFAEAGYELLGEYLNSSTPIRFRCDKGHEHQMSWESFRQGSRCGICFAESLGSGHIKDKMRSRVTNSVSREIARQGLSAHWSDYHDSQTIKEIAEAVDLSGVYKNRPKGHHVDHIIPITKFDLLDEKELRACWSPNNLRYLPALRNISRGNRMTRKEVEMMARNHADIVLNASRLDFNVPVQISLKLF